jgi:hypothetical protein
MATVALVLAALLVVSTVVLFVVAVRRRPGPIALVPGPADRPRSAGDAVGAGRSSLDRLEVGAEVVYDDREWVVIGAQRIARRDGFAGWTAWHLDLKGQPGWMATVDGDDHLIFAVGAERPETIDPATNPVVWRDVPWTRIAETADGPQPVTVEGQRRRNRQPREDLTADALERVTFTRDDLPRRRLILERRVGDERWAAWIGDRVSAGAIDVTRWRSQPS